MGKVASVFNGFRTVLFLLGSAALLQASDVRMDFTRANQMFASDRFGEAAAIYDTLILNHGASPELYYNLGNALARSGDTGRAVLAYERGLVLSPMDAEIKANLEKIRAKKNLFEKPAPFWEQPLLMVPQTIWAALLLSSVWLAVLGFSLRVLLEKKTGKTVRAVLLLAAIVFSLVLILASAACLIAERRGDRAVVLTPDPPLLISPFAGASVSTSLKPGEIVRIGESHSEYIHVRNEEGKSGWVRTRDAEKIR